MNKKKVISFLLAGMMIIPSFSTPIHALTKGDREYIRELAKQEAENEYGKKYKSVILVNENSLTSDGLCASGLVGATEGLFIPIDESNLSAKNLDKSLKKNNRNLKKN